MQNSDIHLDPATLRVFEEYARESVISYDDVPCEQNEHILIFYLDNDEYSLPTRCIREVQQPAAYTPLPTAPPCVVGLAHVQGRTIAALDIRPLLNKPSTPPTPATWLIILHVGGKDMGLVADSVADEQSGKGYRGAPPAPVVQHTSSKVRGLHHYFALPTDDPQTLFADPESDPNDNTAER